MSKGVAVVASIFNVAVTGTMLENELLPRRSDDNDVVDGKLIDKNSDEKTVPLFWYFQAALQLRYFMTFFRSKIWWF